MTIHKEGRRPLFILLLLLTAICYLITYFYPANVLLQNLVIASSVFFYLIILQFFRHPHKVIETNENHVIAPADGKVIVIEQVQETEYFQNKRQQVSIFMSPINVHVNRMPIGGVIKYFRYHPGKYLVAWHPKSSKENEQTTVVAENKAGVQILFRQIAGLLARRIKWYIDENHQLKQGQEFGFIKFGSRVDLYLPLNAKITVNIGDKAVGGKTVIAELA